MYKELTYNGITKTIADWARELGMSYGKLNGRIKMGWPIEEVLGYSAHRYNRLRITYNGETHTANRWEEITGIDNTVIRSRIKLGWPLGEALGYKKHIHGLKNTKRKKK